MTDNLEKQIENTSEVEEPSLFEQTKKMRDETAAMQKQIEENLKQMDKLASEILISGKSVAGSKPKEITQSDIAQEKANKILNMFK